MNAAQDNLATGIPVQSPNNPYRDVTHDIFAFPQCSAQPISANDVQAEGMLNALLAGRLLNEDEEAKPTHPSFAYPAGYRTDGRMFPKSSSPFTHEGDTFEVGCFELGETVSKTVECGSYYTPATAEGGNNCVLACPAGVYTSEQWDLMWGIYTIPGTLLRKGQQADDVLRTENIHLT
jgi:hypothetical protein